MIDLTQIEAGLGAQPIYMIRTQAGQMRMSSLRPGDFLLAEGVAEMPVCVLINSPKMKRIVIWWIRSRLESNYAYATILTHPEFTYLGHGKRRAWWKLLPKFIRKHICEYSKP